MRERRVINDVFFYVADRRDAIRHRCHKNNF